MGLVKTRRLAAMQKQHRAKAGIRPICRSIAFLKLNDSKVQLTFDKEDQS